MATFLRTQHLRHGCLSQDSTLATWLPFSGPNTCKVAAFLRTQHLYVTSVDTFSGLNTCMSQVLTLLRTQHLLHGCLSQDSTLATWLPFSGLNTCYMAAFLRTQHLRHGCLSQDSTLATWLSFSGLNNEISATDIYLCRVSMFRCYGMW